MGRRIQSKNGRADRPSVVYLLGRALIPNTAWSSREGGPQRAATVGIGTRKAMPSLVRFLSIIAIIAAVIYAGVYALAHLVQPKPREITVSIPPDKFAKQP